MIKVKNIGGTDVPKDEELNSAIEKWQKEEGIADEAILSINVAFDGEMGLGSWFNITIAYKQS